MLMPSVYVFGYPSYLIRIIVNNRELLDIIKSDYAVNVDCSRFKDTLQVLLLNTSSIQFDLVVRE